MFVRAGADIRSREPVDVPSWRATFAGTTVLERMNRMDTAVSNGLGAPTGMKTERHDRECSTSRLASYQLINEQRMNDAESDQGLSRFALCGN